MSTDVVQATVADVTAEEWNERKEQAAELFNQLRTALLADRASAWAIAEALYQMHEVSAWVLLGHESLTEFLASPELGMSKSTYHRYVSVYHELVVRRELPVDELLDVDITKADVVLAAVRDARVEVEAAVADARTLAKRDLREKYAIEPPKATPSGGTTAAPAPKEVTVDEAPVVAAEVQGEDTPAPPTNDVDVPAFYEGAAPEGVVVEVSGITTSTSTRAVQDMIDTVAQEPEPTPDERSVVGLEEAVLDLRTAWESNAGFPRISRRTVKTLLTFFVENFDGNE